MMAPTINERIEREEYLKDRFFEAFVKAHPFTAVDDMADLRQGLPYIWVNDLAKLYAHDDFCFWKAWFRAHYERLSYNQIEATFPARRNLVDPDMLTVSERREWERRGYIVFEDDWLRVQGSIATLGGKPGLVAVKDGHNVVINCISQPPENSDKVIVMLYMYLLPLHRGAYYGQQFDGRLAYPNGKHIDIAADAVDDKFMRSISEVIRDIASDTPPPAAPSWYECSRCRISSEDCKNRYGGNGQSLTTTYF